MPPKEFLDYLLQDIENRKDFHKIASNVIVVILIGVLLNMSLSDNLTSLSLIVLVGTYGVLFIYPIIFYSYIRFNEYNHAIIGIKNLYFEFGEDLKNHYSKLTKIIDLWLTPLLIVGIIRLIYNLLKKILKSKKFWIGFIIIMSIIITFLEVDYSIINKTELNQKRDDFFDKWEGEIIFGL